ncbi:MAG: hypothetical protein ACEQSB_00025 [Undibacterium sp.]
MNSEENLREFLGYDDVSLPIIEALDNGRYVAILKLLFTHAIIIGKQDDKNSFTDRWRYESALDATIALAEWKLIDYACEPQDAPSSQFRAPA